MIRVIFIMILMFAIVASATIIIVVMALEVTVKDWLKGQDLSSLLMAFVAVQPMALYYYQILASSLSVS